MSFPEILSLPVVVALFIVAVALFSGDKLGPAIRDLFRGGPRPPSHPIPADDSKILNRHRSRWAE
jgi:hypothetical protein